MKKQVSAILAASMAASMLVACGGSTSGAATSTAPAESTSTASSEAAPAESTADAGQAADLPIHLFEILGLDEDLEFIRHRPVFQQAHRPDLHDLAAHGRGQRLFRRMRAGPRLIPFHIQNYILHRYAPSFSPNHSNTIPGLCKLPTAFLFLRTSSMAPA